MSTLHLSAVVFRRGEWYIGQFLEHDIATQARSYEDLLRDMRRILVAHVTIAREGGGTPFEKIPPAPRRYWQLFEEGAPLAPTPGAPGLPMVDVALHGTLRDLSLAGTAPPP